MENLAAPFQFIKNKKSLLKNSAFFFGGGLLFGVVYLTVNSFNSPSAMVENVHSTLPNHVCVYQKVNSICKDRNYSFAGEAVPKQDQDVMERLDREMVINTYWQSSTLLSLKLADKYFPIIEPILREHNIPDDFKYIALIESGLRDVVSPSGATGKWQLMKETAKLYGMMMNDDIDERYNLEKTTHAACKYFQQAYDTLGSWTDAAASYNIGITGMKNRLRDQKVNSFYDLWLTSETSRYVFRIVAMKELYENPRMYGYYYDKAESYKPDVYDVVLIDQSTDWVEMAERFQMKYKELRALNPWIRSYKFNNKNMQEFEVKIKKRN